MYALLILIACKGTMTIDTTDSTPNDSSPPLPDVAAVELVQLDDDRYAPPVFVGGELLLHDAVRGVLVALDPEALPERWPWQYNLRSVQVAAASRPRMEYLDGVGLWIGGDPLDDGADATLIDPASFAVLRTVPGGGADAAMVGGVLQTAYPGVWQLHDRINEPGRLETVGADGSLTVSDPELCGAIGSHCGKSMAVLRGSLWWSDWQGGLYHAGAALHLEDGVLVNGAPAFVAGEAAKSNRTNVAALDDDRLFVGGVIDCGAILDTTTGAQTPYSAMDGCGFSAVEGESYHGSRVRVVSLDLALGGGGYGALRVEWLDGVHAGEVQVVTLPFVDEAYSCWPMAAMGPRGLLAVTCDGGRGLFVGRVTG